MGVNYYDPLLFKGAQQSLGIFTGNTTDPSSYINLPTTTYAQYKTAVTSAYNSLPPGPQMMVDYHMSALTEVVSSGVTTDPDYWSASSANGTFIVNSGLTTSKIGIGTMVPNHELSVSGTISASSSLYGGVTDVTNLKIAGAQGSDGQVLTSTGSGVAWEDSSGGMTSFTVDGDNGTAFPITNGETLEFVGQTGIDIGVADPEVRVAIDYDGVDSFIMAAANGTSITVDGANDKLVIYDNDAAEVKYINADQLPGGSSSSYWSASSANANAIVNSGMSTSKVGIGTLRPNHELSVAGTISADTSILVGSDCIIKSPEQGSVFIGDDAGANWDAGSTSNTSVGRLSMGLGTMNDAVQNTAFGFATLGYITTGDYNTAVGLQANTSIDTGSWNTAIGKTSMFGATYHSYNTAVGANTMYFTTSSSLGKTVPTDTHNTAVGYSSQYYNLNGAYNSSLGSQAIGNSTIAYAGTGSTAMGFKALFNNTTGSYNVAVGYQAGDNVTSGDYNISIGTNADPDSATADYQLNIGDTIIGKDLVGDNLSINAVGIGTAVTSSLLTHTFTVSGDTLINGDLVCSGDIDGGTF